MKRFFLLLTTVISLISTAASAREISVFAVNFSENELRNIVSNEIEKLLQRNDVVIGIIDAGEARFAGYFASEHPEFGNDGAVRGIKSEVANRFGAARKPINLPLVLSEINEFVLSHYKSNDIVRVYLVDVLEHKGRSFSFETGFPNDGFLTLQDSDFHLIQALPQEIDSSVSVVQLTKNQFQSQYLKFSYHLSKTVLGGNLTSFAFASSAPPLSFDEPITVDVPDLETVTASRVINAEERPVCEVEDLVQVVQKADRLEVSVQNISRANSVGNFLLTVGASSDERQFSFDSNGKGSFNVKRLPGKGTLSVSDCAGVMQEHYSYDVDELDDVISVVGVSEGVAKISGENVQRIDGSDVVIVDENTGRRWVTQAADGQYSIEVPIAPGKHVFYAERPFSGEKQYFDVLLQEKCTLSSNLSYGGAVGRLSVQSTCTTQDALSLSYNNERYSARFGSNQMAEIEFPLTCGTTYGLWQVDQQPENEFVVQYAISPDQIAVAEGSSKVSIAITNPTRANSEAKYAAVIGDETFEGNITFNADGIGTVELPRTSPGSGMFNLEDCQGNLAQAGTYKVTQIDDDIDVTVLSDERARIVGENIQRTDGSRVTIKNEDTGERWTAIVQNGRYSLEVAVPPGLQNFSASKPYGSGTYPFTVKVRDPCDVNHELKKDGGLGLLTVSTDCSPKDRRVKLSYDGIEYSERLDSDNTALFRFPLACDAATGSWTLDAEKGEFDTSFSCDGLVRVIVHFEANANLNLYVHETLDRNSKNGDVVSHGNCNYSKGDAAPSCDGGIGRLLIDVASRTDTTNTQYYEAKISDFDGTKYVVAMVEYYDRNQNHMNKTVPAEFCGSGAKARVPYTMKWYDGSRWSKKNFVIQPLPCGSIVPENLFQTERQKSILLVR